MNSSDFKYEKINNDRNTNYMSWLQSQSYLVGVVHNSCHAGKKSLVHVCSKQILLRDCVKQGKYTLRTCIK